MDDSFGYAGQRLYDALSDDSDPFSIGVMIIEAARIADRLDTLHLLLSGDDQVWIRLDRGRDGVLEVRVDSALQEARQQATVLRQLLSEIRRQKGDGDRDPSEDDDLAGL